MTISDLVWAIASKWTGQPAAQMRCSHPTIGRDYRLELLAEENATDYYEVCLNCGKEWRDD